MIPYVIGVLICYGVLLYTQGQVHVLGMMSLYTIILNVVIRLYFVRKYAINSQSSCTECITGFFCTPCSIAQSK